MVRTKGDAQRYATARGMSSKGKIPPSKGKHAPSKGKGNASLAPAWQGQGLGKMNLPTPPKRIAPAVHSKNRPPNATEFSQARLVRAQYDAPVNTNVVTKQPRKQLANKVALLKARKAVDGIVKKHLAKRRAKNGTGALKEIRKYQKTTDLLIRKAPFHRVAR